ncbi:hypothetical protein AEAC466_17245 [Asticcacaulis sp. AC466]|nr:hypothetical protein AEAC466_17245 [Asticcacaulis sp. AC466]
MNDILRVLVIGGDEEARAALIQDIEDHIDPLFRQRNKRGVNYHATSTSWNEIVLRDLTSY